MTIVLADFDRSVKYFSWRDSVAYIQDPDFNAFPGPRPVVCLGPGGGWRALGRSSIELSGVFEQVANLLRDEFGCYVVSFTCPSAGRRDVATSGQDADVPIQGLWPQQFFYFMRLLAMAKTHYDDASWWGTGTLDPERVLCGGFSASGASAIAAAAAPSGTLPFGEKFKSMSRNRWKLDFDHRVRGVLSNWAACEVEWVAPGSGAESTYTSLMQRPEKSIALSDVPLDLRRAASAWYYLQNNPSQKEFGIFGNWPGTVGTPTVKLLEADWRDPLKQSEDPHEPMYGYGVWLRRTLEGAASRDEIHYGNNTQGNNIIGSLLKSITSAAAWPDLVRAWINSKDILA